MYRLSRLPNVLILTCALALPHFILSPPARAEDAPQPATSPTDLGRLPADALIMRQQMLVDPYLNMNAFSVLVPDKWKLTPEFAWQNGIPQPSIGVIVIDPVQRVGWRSFPQLRYVAGRREAEIAANPRNRAALERIYAEGVEVPGFEIRKLPLSPRDYVLTLLVPRFCPDVAAATDVNVVSESDLPNLANALAGRDPLHPQVRSSRIRITFSAAGDAKEAEFVSSIFIYKNSNSDITLWTATSSACAAPRGKLDALMPTFTAIGTSVTPQLAWYNCRVQVGWQIVQQHLQLGFEEIRNDQERFARRMDALHNLARQTSAEVSEKIRNDFDIQQKAKSDVQEQFLHYVNDTASFHGPNGGPNVTLPAGYQFQYSNNSGQFIQTNIPSFQPPPGWQQMQPAN